jgi:hypothetical protein
MGRGKGKDIRGMVVITFIDAHREKERNNTSINRCNLFVMIRSRARRDYFDEIAYVILLRE